MGCHPIESEIARIWPPLHWNDVTTLVGVSGGPDSVALVRALAGLADGKGQLRMVYFDHQWREASSVDDLAFVENLASELDLPFHFGSAAGRDREPGQGREGVAREQRFSFFEEIAELTGARHLALGHNRDDHVETVLHRVLRGTGPTGLAGIRVFRCWGDGRSIVHPLRHCSRDDILDYLSQLGQPFLTDPTNADTSLTRNRLRRDLLPKLREEYNPQVDQALLRISKWSEDFQSWLTDYLAPLELVAVMDSTDYQMTIDCRAIKEHPDFLVREMMRKLWSDRNWPLMTMSANHWSQLAAMILGPEDCPPIVFPGVIRAARQQHQLVIQRETAVPTLDEESTSAAANSRR